MFIPCSAMAGRDSDRIIMKKSARQNATWAQKVYDRSNVNYIAACVVLTALSFAITFSLAVIVSSDDFWMQMLAAKFVLLFTIFAAMWLIWFLHARKVRLEAFKFLAAEQLVHNRMIYVVPNKRPDPVSQEKINELEALIDEE